MKLGRYEIVKQLGRGSMGVVYLARDPVLERLVAVKVLGRNSADESDFAGRFLKEAKAIARLSHPGIVTIYDVENDAGNLYIAMEYLEGVSLSKLIHDGSIPIEDALRYAIQIADSLDYAHRQGVVHRDIKPGNIILTRDATTHITDFGIARIEDSSMTLQTQAGTILGTPAYMSPEQALGKTADSRSDIFSLGAMLYEMTVGHRPFGKGGKTLVSVLTQIVTTTPKPPCTLSGKIPSDVSALIMKAMEKDPADRFPTAQALSAELKACLIHMTEPVEKKPRRLWPVLLALTGILAAGWSYFFYTRWTDPHSVSTQTVAVKHMNAGTPQSVSAPVVPEPDLSPQPSTPEVREKPARPVVLTTTETPEMPSPQILPVPQTVTPETHQTSPVSKKKETAKPLIQLASEPKPGSEPKPRPKTRPKQKLTSKPTPVTAPHKTVCLVPVMLRSIPSGAQVYIDSRLKATTPTTLMLSAGGHWIRLSLSGYMDTGRDVTIPEIMEYPLVFTLKPLAQP